MEFTDPSAMTTAAIHREVSVIERDLTALRADLQRDLAQRGESRQREQESQDKVFEAKLKGIQDVFEGKIVAINDATQLRLESVAGIPDSIKSEISHHEDLQIERFQSIAQQFNERDIRTEQAGKASTEALAAALQAAKELVGAQGEASAAAAIKSETSFTKQIDQIGTIIQTLEKALDARITELKERIDRGEGSTTGARDTRIEYRDQATDQRSGSSLMVAVIAAFLVALSLGVGIAGLVFGK